MSNRPHPLRQSHTVDFGKLGSGLKSIHRQPSNTSSASSGYSHASEFFDLVRPSTSSSMASSTFGSSAYGHKRGMSESPVRQASPAAPRPITSYHEPRSSAHDVYSMARQSLRPLAQAPASGARPSPSPPLSKPDRRQERHERPQSIDMGHLGSHSIAAASAANGMSPTSTPSLSRPLPTPPVVPAKARPTSMLLTRSDSIRPRMSAAVAAHSSSSALPHPPIPIAAPDLQDLGRSSTSHLRTLSQLAQSGEAEDFSIKLPAQQVVGLTGRRRLQRTGNARTAGQQYGFGGRNWMDKQRHFLQAYEYLCHIGEAKEWIEDIIHQPIQTIVELDEALRNGITLAEVVAALNPDRRYKIFRHERLQARHWDNIATFFRYLDEVGLPDLFRFELIDLYEKKNMPKVIYCVHALSWLLYRKGIVDFRIGNLVGQLEFEHHELEAMQKGLDNLGVNMPSFGTMGADFGVEPAPEPEETEEERIDRELAEKAEMVIDLQAQIRGAVVRMRLAEAMHQLWDAEIWIVELQSRLRGDWTRQIMDYRLQMRRFAVLLQSSLRGFLVRARMLRRERIWESKQEDIIKLQSLARAMAVRRGLADTRSGLARARGSVRDVQAIVRGFLVRKRMAGQQRETRRVHGPVKALQSAIRGMMARASIKKDLCHLGRVQDRVTGLQSAVRGRLVRTSVHSYLSSLSDAEDSVTQFQSAWRAFMVRARVKQDARGLESGRTQGSVTKLQSALRGMMARASVAQDVSMVKKETVAVTQLQAASRAMLLRREKESERQAIQVFAPQWEAVQSWMRGEGARKEIDRTRAQLGTHEAEIGRLQSHIRAAATRRHKASRLESLAEHESAVAEAQSMTRGMLVRQGLAADLDSLDALTPEISSLQATIRGSLFRMRHSALLDELESDSDRIGEMQSLARAMLCRLSIGELLSELEEHEETIRQLQSLGRGFLVVKQFAAKKKHFEENMQKVVKIQSFVRGRLQGEAYKSLTTGKNPPVGAVKNFVHLLNDSDFDFNEEMEFERMRKTVVQQVRQNEMVEQYIDQLDIKIALLVKNKITLDDVVRHQSNFGGHSSNLLANSSMASANQFDLKALNKSSRKKLESYQQLFFNLQTQPHYLGRLFRRIREQGWADKECKAIEHLVMALFGYAQKRREEYYLLKLIARSIREEMDSCDEMQDYLRRNFVWCKVLGSYTRSPRDRKFLRDLLGPLIRDNIMDDPALDLESDPMQIYRVAINNEELRTGQASARPLNIPRDVAIKDAETRELFIDHLRDLREICHQFLTALEAFLPKMPYGIRYICQQTFDALSQRFRREKAAQMLQLVSNWLWRFYLQPALLNPEQVGLMEKSMGFLQKKNLSEVAKVLGQIAQGRPFGGDNIYLQPLNAFVAESITRLTHITSQLVAVPDAESTFDIDEFNDLFAKNKPTLYIKMTDIFAIHGLLAQELAHVCPSRDDVLREIMQDLGSAKNNESEMVAAGSSDIQLFLSAKLHDVEDPEAEIKALFMETKRCILYIIRVQTGTNLLDILVRPPTPEDEVKWQAILRQDFASSQHSKGAYSDANMVDVTRMTYYDMKRNALENIMRLEQTGRISKHNHYQDVLNAIALDIRTKSRRRVQRQRELDGVRMTLGNLHQKARYLEQQRKSYDDYIEQAMATLQKNKGKKRFLLPFTKQYNHQRELERSGRVPRFGSYKYSARALAEKGVLVSWRGLPERDWGAVNLTVSCDQVGLFNVEASRGHIQMPGAAAALPIEDLLQAQFEARQFIALFDDESALRLNVNLLLHLLYKKFYRTQ